MARTPGSNTLLYLPFTTDTQFNNLGTGPQFTKGTSPYVSQPIITTKDGIQCAKFYRNDYQNIISSNAYVNIGKVYTVSFRVNLKYIGQKTTIYGSTHQDIYIANNSQIYFSGVTNSSGTVSAVELTAEYQDDKWIYVTLVCNNGSFSAYSSGKLQHTYTYYNYNINENVFIGSIEGYISNFIIENKARTDSEIQSYYNDTAWKYGLAPAPTILYGSSPIKEMYYGTGVEVWDTQGPSPDGFHVPTKTDWENVVNAGISLGRRTTTSGDGIKNYLKLPYCGEINGSSAAFSDKGSRGYYWMSTAYDNNAEGCYLLIGSSYVRADQKTYRTYGHSIRPFKNSPVVPDSTWTIIYQGTGNAGIFHNASLGLISISSDGVTWYTIADKNLGATAVYNNGDTLSEANCGNFYQRGNNYKFSWSTSPSVLYSTQTNASGYGPGNYYSSSGFRYRNSSPFGWDSSDNRNLRGGVSQGVSPGVIAKKIKEVYYGSKKIRPAETGYELPELTKWNAIDQKVTFGGWGYGPLFVNDNYTNIFNGGVANSVKSRGKLSIPGDISTIGNTVTTTVPSNVSTWSGNATMAFNADGSVVYMNNGGGSYYKYNCNTPYDIANKTQVSNFSLGNSGRFFCFGDDGKKFYTNENGITEYTLSTPYEVTSSATKIGSYTSSRGSSEIGGWCFSPTGKSIYVADYGSSKIWRLDLTSAWNITTCTNATYKNMSYKPLFVGAYMIDGTMLAYTTHNYGTISRWTINN